MTAVAATDDRLARRNALILSAATALAGANATVIFATGAILGSMLAPSQALATLPVSVFVVGMASATLPVGVIARLYGRRAAFQFGTICGALAGCFGCLASLNSSFVLFCVVSALLIAAGLVRGSMATVAQNGIMLVINAYGVWRYLISPKDKRVIDRLNDGAVEAEHEVEQELREEKKG